jgi:hypothetical protein
VISVNEQNVIAAVREHIKDKHPGGATLEVLEQGIRHEHDWWYVPIRPSVEPVKRYEYYEALAEVEKDLVVSDHLTVLLVPTASQNGQFAA